MKLKFSVFMMLLVSNLALGSGGAFGAPHYDRSCGVLPGEGYGYVDYVRAANTICRRARKVTRKAYKKFCRARSNCAMSADTGLYKGKVRRNGWRCKVTVGWEYIRSKCRRGKMRVLWITGA